MYEFLFSYFTFGIQKTKRFPNPFKQKQQRFASSSKSQSEIRGFDAPFGHQEESSAIFFLVNNSFGNDHAWVTLLIFGSNKTFKKQDCWRLHHLTILCLCWQRNALLTFSTQLKALQRLIVWQITYSYFCIIWCLGLSAFRKTKEWDSSFSQ